MPRQHGRASKDCSPSSASRDILRPQRTKSSGDPDSRGHQLAQRQLETRIVVSKNIVSGSRQAPWASASNGNAGSLKGDGFTQYWHHYIDTQAIEKTIGAKRVCPGPRRRDERSVWATIASRSHAVELSASNVAESARFSIILPAGWSVEPGCAILA